MSKALKNLEASDKFAEKHFDEIVDFLWKKRKTLIYFDDPDYGGLPKKFIKGLSGDFVDAISMAFEHYWMGSIKTKREFGNHCGRYIYAQ